MQVFGWTEVGAGGGIGLGGLRLSKVRLEGPASPCSRPRYWGIGARPGQAASAISGQDCFKIFYVADPV